MKGFVRQPNSLKWSISSPKNCTQSKLYPFYLADMDFPVYPVFQEQFQKRIANINNFTYKNRSEAYLKSLMQWFKTQYGCQGQQYQIKKDYIISSPSTCHLYIAVVLAFSKMEDSILTFTSVFDFYSKSANILGRNAIESRLKTVKDSQTGLVKLQIDFQDFQRKIIESNKKCKIIAFNNPHNPSGRIWTKQQIQKLINIASKYSIYIFSDEIFSDLRLNHKINQFYTLAKHKYKKIIVGNSISKSFNMGSLQGGYGIIRNHQVRKQLQIFSQEALNMLPNEPATIMSQIIFSEGRGNLWLKQIRTLIETNFSKLIKFKDFYCPKLIIYSLDGAYLVLVDFKNYFKDQDELRFKLQSKCIILNIISKYFTPSQKTTMARISIAVQQNFFDQFLITLNKALTNDSKL